MLCPYIPNFWIALGKAEEGQEHYEEAATAYSVGATGEYLEIVLTAVDCLKKAGLVDKAKAWLQYIIENTDKTEETKEALRKISYLHQSI